MRCLFCTAILKPGPKEVYETLVEHAFDPNNEDIILRDTFVCGCSISYNCFWNPDGEFYTGNLSRGHTTLLARIKKHSSIGSLEEEINKQIDKKYGHV